MNLQESVKTIDSREVAEMLDMRHADILRKIENYIEVLTNAELRSLDFFIASNYKDTKGETRPCYLFTKMGCEFIANKFTGEKGILFTAKYVQKFNLMEQSSNIATQKFSPQLQLLINMEMKQQEHQQALLATNHRIDNMVDIISLDTNSWREDAKKLIVKIAYKMGGVEYIRDVNSEIYKLVNSRANVSLETRLTNKRNRMAGEGIAKSRRDKLNALDVISDDKKLIEIYIAIVKRMAVKYKIDLPEGI